MYGAKFYDLTGTAQWIWPQHRLAADVPVAFFAAREFDLPPNRHFTHLRILGDPEYTVWFNGKQIGGRRAGTEPSLDLFDVSSLARDGRNRVLVAVRSRRGVGGLIAGIDIAPELTNWIVTDAGWKIFRSWHAELPLRDRGTASAPMLLGAPPAGRWNFPPSVSAAIATPAQRVVRPRTSFAVMGQQPTTRIIEGVAVAGREPVPATVFDFGHTSGRVRLQRGSGAEAVITIGFANIPEELRAVPPMMRPFVFAAGEREVTDPETVGFRYVIVYGDAAPVVLQ